MLFYANVNYRNSYAVSNVVVVVLQELPCFFCFYVYSWDSIILASII